MDGAKSVAQVAKVAQWNSWPEKSRQVAIAGAPLYARDSRCHLARGAADRRSLL
ncbi:hypothetical protein [Sphingomonas sp.]|uniref:hypothetical protein n=1 Tax=Sphingomonas sp. TaxID=28214 RepID=UPI0035BC63CC